jgi:hypothetical protein
MCQFERLVRDGERSVNISHAGLLKPSCGYALCWQVRVEPSYPDVSCMVLVLVYTSDPDLGGGAGSKIGL